MYSILVFGLLFVTIYCEEMPCDPPIEGCTCDTQVLKCGGESCTQFPANAPPGTTEFIFDSCSIPSISSVPYTEAKTLAIVNNKVPLVINEQAFENLANLNALELHNSQIMDFNSKTLSGIGNLQILSLTGNNIREIKEDTFQSVQSLHQIYLDDNVGIKINRKAFQGLDKLAALEIANCELTDLPDFPDNLIILNLVGNKFTDIPDNAFDDLDKLEELYLGNCGLEEVNELSGLDSLVTLDLSHNKLKEIDDDLLDDSEVTRLYVENNQLTKLPKDLVKWNNLLDIRLAGNPWDCSCENSWMQAIHRNSKENITCASPPEFKGQDLHNVTTSLSCPTNNASTIVLAITIPLLIIFVLLLIYYVYKMCQTRRRKGGKKNVRYSSVYKDTVETVSGKGRPIAEM